MSHDLSSFIKSLLSRLRSRENSSERRLTGRVEPNYHPALDNYANLNFTAFTVMTKALAASVAHYTMNLESIPVRDSVERGMYPRSYYPRSYGGKLIRKGRRKI